MAAAKRSTFFRITIEDRPGALLALARNLKAKNTALVALKASESRPGESEAHLIPKNPDKLRDVLRLSGVPFEEGISFLVKGADKTGALVKSLEAIAGAGVNIITTDAIAAGGSYAAFFRVAPGDLERTAKALGAK